MKRKQLVTTLAVSVISSYSFAAESVTAIDLQRAYTAALEYDATIAAAKSALESDQEQSGYALSFLLPNVSLTGSGGYSKSSIDYAVDTGPVKDKTTEFYLNYGAALRLAQPIYRKNYIDGYRQSKFAVEQGEVKFQLAAQDLALRTTQAYFDVLSAENNVELSGVELQATAKQLERAKKALDVGTATITEVHEAQARFDLTNARAIAAKSQLDIAQQTLTRLIGATPGKFARLRDSLPLTLPEPMDIGAWKQTAANENLKVRIAQLAVDVARLEIGRQRGLAYPSLDLVASYGTSYAGDSTFGSENTSTTTKVGVELSMPLYAGGAISVKTRQLNAEKMKAEHLRDDALREADLQTQQTFSNIVSGVEQIKALQQVEKSSQSSLDSTQKGFELGLRTLVDVLNAQQQLFTAKRDLMAAKYQYLVNRLKLKAAVGQLTANDIAAINAVLEMK